MGRLDDVRPATANLRMLDGTTLQTSGVITLTVGQPTTKTSYELDFYVAPKHDQPLLGFKACRALDLLRVVDENICVVGQPQTTTGSTTASEPTCLTEAGILTEYPDLFEGVVHLEVDEAVQPVQMPLRRVPIGIREKVESELQRLEAQGI